MEISLSHLGLILMQHSKNRLGKVLQDLKGEKINTRAMAKAEIVQALQGYSEKELVKSFDGSLFTSNQSLTFVKFTRFHEVKGEKVLKDVSNGIIALKKNIKDFSKLEKLGESPQILKSKPDLLKIIKISREKTGFLFANKGATVFIRKNLKLIESSEPNFDLCVWDNDSGILQVRSAHNVDYYKDFFAKNLKNSPDAHFQSLIVDPGSFDVFVRKINGTVRTVKGKDQTRQKGYLEKEFKSQGGADVRMVPTYNADLQGYEILSHGVDFKYEGESYTIYVGFKKGTVWLRFGEPTEKLIQKLQKVISEL